MKIEKRGKYPGVKVHLEPAECEVIIGGKVSKIITLTQNLGVKIHDLMEECPTLLQERTQEEIKKELENELLSAQKKLEVMSKGGDWKGVHVK